MGIEIGRREPSVSSGLTFQITSLDARIYGQVMPMPTMSSRHQEQPEIVAREDTSDPSLRGNTSNNINAYLALKCKVYSVYNVFQILIKMMQNLVFCVR